jgi:hypothetical protein
MLVVLAGGRGREVTAALPPQQNSRAAKEELSFALAPGMKLEAARKQRILDPRFEATKKELSEQIKSGKLPEAKASMWGFNKEDATEYLQAAIDSGIRKLVVDNTGNDWILNRTIVLTSRQEVVLEDGVTVRAKKDCHHGVGDALFRARGVANVALRGIGNVRLIMNKKDYMDPKLYKGALGGRHVLTVSGCNNVLVENITFKEAGGDGIYITGGTTDMVVDHVVCDGNYRLGMAVISAKNLTVKNSRFINARGGSPEGGIDFEPNVKNEMLVNCLVENCIFENNVRGAGISISPNHIDRSSAPVSITVRGCKFRNNALSMFLYPTRGHQFTSSTGTVDIINCELGNVIQIANPVDDGVLIRFKDCVGINPDPKSGPYFDVRSRDTKGRRVGNIKFEAFLIKDDVPDRAPIAIRYLGAGDVSDAITGDIAIERNGKREKVDLGGYVKERQKYFRKINEQIPAQLDLASLRIPAKDAERVGNSGLYLRGDSTFLQYAEEGKPVTVNVRILKSGYDAAGTVQVIDPGGKNAGAPYKIPCDNKPVAITFTPGKTGIYKIESRSINCLDISSSHRGSGLYVPDPFLTFLMPNGKLYLRVPAGVQEFTVGVSADAGSNVSLCDPSGRAVRTENGIRSMTLFTGSRSDASKDEVWSLRFSRSIWEVTLRIYKPLTPVVSTNPDVLFK